MCQAKPGPRCSADTHKVLVSSYAKVVQAEQTFNKLNELNVNGNLNNEVLLAEQQLNQERTNYSKDYHMFYATRSGFETLQNKIKQLEGKTVLVREGALMDDGDWADASYKEYASWKESNILERAKIHRQWQISTSKALESIEATSPEIAIKRSYELRESISNNVNSVRRLLAEHKNQEQAILDEVISTRNSSDSVEKLRQNRRTVHAFETYLTYASIEFNDLKDYENTVRKRSNVLV